MSLNLYAVANDSLQMIHATGGDFENHRRALRNLISGIDEHLQKIADNPETVMV